jgi:hypothetical protein
VARPQDCLLAAVFYPFGHPTTYAYAPHMTRRSLMLITSSNQENKLQELIFDSACLLEKKMFEIFIDAAGAQAGEDYTYEFRI